MRKKKIHKNALVCEPVGDLVYKHSDCTSPQDVTISFLCSLQDESSKWRIVRVRFQSTLDTHRSSTLMLMSLSVCSLVCNLSVFSITAWVHFGVWVKLRKVKFRNWCMTIVKLVFMNYRFSSSYSNLLARLYSLMETWWYYCRVFLWILGSYSSYFNFLAKLYMEMKIWCYCQVCF